MAAIPARLRPIIPLIVLAIVLALAAPLTIAAWLYGGHVTPAQALRHAQAVAEKGAHEHAAPAGHHDHGTPAETPNDGPFFASVEVGATLTTIGGAAFFGVWRALPTALTLLLPLLAQRRAERPPPRSPTDHRGLLTDPPPRSCCPAPV